MGRHVAGDAPALEKLLEESLAGIGSDVGSLAIPLLKGVVLGGGYARGEGGAWEGERENAPALSNDLDFFAVTEDGTTDADAARVAAALEPVAAKWKGALGIDVDFAVKTPWRIKHDEMRLMIQELVHGYFDVCGERGETMFAGVSRLDPSGLPWMEAVRLLMNRGAGLLLAGEEGMRDEGRGMRDEGRGMRDEGRGKRDGGRGKREEFVNRNINKCILGAGDARLIAKGAYEWRAADRAEALGDRLYRAAVEWKFRPKGEPVCGWETARCVWLDAKKEVAAAGRSRKRSLRAAARWIARRRTAGDFATFGMEPEVRVLERIARLIETRSAFDSGARRDWEIFN